MNYYQIEKEQKVIKIKYIWSDATAIINKLDDIESKVGIENILPFYDEITEIILSGSDIKPDELDNIYQLYDETFKCSCMKLGDAFRCLSLNFKSCADEFYKLMPWYSKLWYRIKKFFKLA